MTDTPFGNPDGSRSDLTEVIDDFVTFDELIFGAGLGIRQDDLSARVIVGAKGSGKTVYLRRLQAAASANSSVYADAIQQELPATHQVVKFCQCFSGSTLTENWMSLWHDAILRSLVSHLLHAPALASVLTPDQRTELISYAPRLYPQFRHPLSVYSQVVSIIESYGTDHQYIRYFHQEDWAELEALLSDIIRQAPPIYFFIDSVDEEYANAPMFWLRCQLGLFYRTMRLLRDAKFGGKLHVIVCIRDHALSAVLRGEHANRYRDEPHIRSLNWDFAAASFFLQQKLRRLPRTHLMEPDNVSLSLVGRWLGIDEIKNVGRGIDEPILIYLLRHTRLLPRDIVMLGNRLCSAVLNAKRQGGALQQKVIRDCVHKLATSFGNEQIAICANQIVSSGMPKEAGRKNFTEVYTGDNEYVRGFDDRIKAVIQSIGKDKFSMTELEVASDLAKSEFGDASDAFSVLWQNRLLGFRDRTASGEREIFFSEVNNENFNLPTTKTEYIFHSCVIDSCGIKAVGREPAGNHIPDEQGNEQN